MADNQEPIIEGLYDTHDKRGLRMKVAGDEWFRIHITPQGEVRTGDGTVPPVALGGGAGLEARVDRMEDRVYDVRSYGAVAGSASVQDTAIQAAIDACSAAGGGAVTGTGKFTVNNLTLASNVVLWAPSANSYAFDAGQSGRGFTLAASATATGYMVTIPANAHNAGVVGLTLIGRGAVNADQSGIYVSAGAKRCAFEYLGIYSVPMFGINIDSGSGSYGHRVFACDIFAGRRPLVNLGAAERVAGLRINASDCYVDGNCEIQCGPSDGTVDTSFRRIAVWLGPLAAACSLQGVIAELSDLGYVVEANYNRLVGCRADLNYGHGFWIGRISTGNAQSNRLVGCLGLSNGQGTHNTYDNFHFEANGGTCNANVATACVSASLVTNKHRYGFYDGGSTPTLTVAGNTFDDSCEDTSSATSPRGAVAGTHAQTSIDGGRSGQVTVTGGGTPNINTARVLLITDGLTYTDFLGAPIGARVFIWTSVAAGVVLTHSAGLRLKGSVSRTLNAYETITLRRVSTGWLQEQV